MATTLHKQRNVMVELNAANLAYIRACIQSSMAKGGSSGSGSSRPAKKRKRAPSLITAPGMRGIKCDSRRKVVWAHTPSGRLQVKPPEWTQAHINTAAAELSERVKHVIAAGASGGADEQDAYCLVLGAYA